jgi:hypothetical protein
MSNNDDTFEIPEDGLFLYIWWCFKDIELDGEKVFDHINNRCMYPRNIGKGSRVAYMSEGTKDKAIMYTNDKPDGIVYGHYLGMRGVTKIDTEFSDSFPNIPPEMLAEFPIIALGVAKVRQEHINQFKREATPGKLWWKKDLNLTKFWNNFKVMHDEDLRWKWTRWGGSGKGSSEYFIKGRIIHKVKADNNKKINIDSSGEQLNNPYLDIAPSSLDKDKLKVIYGNDSPAEFELMSLTEGGFFTIKLYKPGDYIVEYDNIKHTLNSDDYPYNRGGNKFSDNYYNPSKIILTSDEPTHINVVIGIHDDGLYEIRGRIINGNKTKDKDVDEKVSGEFLNDSSKKEVKIKKNVKKKNIFLYDGETEVHDVDVSLDKGYFVISRVKPGDNYKVVVKYKDLVYSHLDISRPYNRGGNNQPDNDSPPRTITIKDASHINVVIDLPGKGKTYQITGRVIDGDKTEKSGVDTNLSGYALNDITDTKIIHYPNLTKDMIRVYRADEDIDLNADSAQLDRYNITNAVIYVDSEIGRFSISNLEKNNKYIVGVRINDKNFYHMIKSGEERRYHRGGQDNPNKPEPQRIELKDNHHGVVIDITGKEQSKFSISGRVLAGNRMQTANVSNDISGKDLDKNDYDKSSVEFDKGDLILAKSVNSKSRRVQLNPNDIELNDGKFKINNLDAGVYLVGIRHNNRVYWHINPPKEPRFYNRGGNPPNNEKVSDTINAQWIRLINEDHKYVVIDVEGDVEDNVEEKTELYACVQPLDFKDEDTNLTIDIDSVKSENNTIKDLVKTPENCIENDLPLLKNIPVNNEFNCSYELSNSSLTVKSIKMIKIKGNSVGGVSDTVPLKFEEKDIPFNSTTKTFILSKYDLYTYNDNNTTKKVILLLFNLERITDLTITGRVIDGTYADNNLSYLKREDGIVIYNNNIPELSYHLENNLLKIINVDTNIDVIDANIQVNEPNDGYFKITNIQAGNYIIYVDLNSGLRSKYSHQPNHFFRVPTQAGNGYCRGGDTPQQRVSHISPINLSHGEHQHVIIAVPNEGQLNVKVSLDRRLGRKSHKIPLEEPFGVTAKPNGRSYKKVIPPRTGYGDGGSYNFNIDNISGKAQIFYFRYRLTYFDEMPSHDTGRQSKDQPNENDIFNRNNQELQNWLGESSDSGSTYNKETNLGKTNSPSKQLNGVGISLKIPHNAQPSYYRFYLEVYRDESCTQLIDYNYYEFKINPIVRHNLNPQNIQDGEVR